MYDLMPYYYYWLVFYNKQNQKEQFAGWKRSWKGSVIFLFFYFLHLDLSFTYHSFYNTG